MKRQPQMMLKRQSFVAVKTTTRSGGYGRADRIGGRMICPAARKLPGDHDHAGVLTCR
jgi:hypothetical protein